MTKQDLFTRDVKELFTQWGATTEDNNQIELQIETRVGKLTLTKLKSDGGKIFSIYARFDEPLKASRVVPPQLAEVNKHSGKCNFHHFDAETCLWLFKKTIEPLITQKPNS